MQQILTKISDIFTSPLFEIGGESVSLLWILQLLIWLLIITFLVKTFKKFLKNRVLGKLRIDEGNREAIATLISYAIGAIGYIIVVQTSGINLAAFAVIVGGLGVGIGFGLQDITKNLVSGLTILMERKLKVGDFIEFEGISGYVEEISIRSTVMRTLAGRYVVIPNSELVENRIINCSYQNFNGRIEIAVGVAYGSDLVLVTETLLKSAYMESSVLENPIPKVVFKGFGDSSLDFELWVWVERVDRALSIKSSLYYIIEYNLRQQDITIPFPQRDLWLKNHEDLKPRSQQNLTDKKLKVPAKKFPVSAATSLSIRDLLCQVPYFHNFNELQLLSLIEIGRPKHLSASEILFRQGEPGNAFCIVLSGGIEAVSENKETETHLFTFGAGQFFGEIPLMLGVPYPTTMRSLSETIVFIIDKEGFERLLKEEPELGEEIVRELGDRQELSEQHQQQLRELGLISVEEEDSNLVVWVSKRIKQLFNL
ncbi:MAG: mechanosensitive ion channel [Okeania sp. SIO2H7]|nr:mechanosensitive ion channel [Okeania sp. SIO2H7]